MIKCEMSRRQSCGCAREKNLVDGRDVVVVLVESIEVGGSGFLYWTRREGETGDFAVGGIH